MADMDENTLVAAESAAEEEAPSPATPTRLSAEELVRLIEDDADGLILFDSDLRFLYLNARAERHLGRSRGDLLGRILWDAFPQMIGARDYELLPWALSERTPVIYEIESRLQFGLWFEVRGIPTASGGLMVYLRDITEERRTRQRLEDSLARLTFHVENSPLAVVEFDSEYRVVSWSGQAETLFGWTSREVRGQRPDEWQFIHEEDSEDVATEVNRLLEGAVDRSVHVNRNYTRDGAIRLVQWNNSALRDDNGKVESILSLGLDLTEQWEGEKAIVESLDALRLSEQRYHSLIEATTAIVWTADAAGCFVEPQLSWMRYTGQGWPAHSGFAWTESLHPEDKERIGAHWRRAVEERPALYEIEGRLWHASSGRYRHSIIRGVPMLDPDGTLREWVGTITDVDEQRRAEAERAQTFARQADIAETLQRSLLITPDPADFPGLDIFTYYAPASDDALIGGDFFDVFAIGEPGGKVALVIGDVTGKGLRAATETAETKFTLRAYLREYPWPQVALHRLNQYLLDRQRLESRPSDVFISAIAVVLDRRSGEATVALAGMEPPLVLRAPPTGRAGMHLPEEIPARGLMLGAMPEWDALPSAFTLGPGDVLLLSSDGLTEARPYRGSRGMFGIDGITRAALTALHSNPHAPLESVGASVTEAALSFAGGRLNDDACLLLVRLAPKR